MSANANGSGFEFCVKALLETRFSRVEPQWASGWIGLFGQAVRCDFCCDDSLIYEVKFQAVGGSAEQKLVYSIEQVKQCHQLPTVLILGGAGYSRGCLAWALQQSSGNLTAVMTVDQFVVSLVKAGR